MDAHYLLAHPVTQAALGGALAAARVDYKAFKSWQSAHDFVSYDWGLAAWRWFQGAVVSALPAAGLSAWLN